jgi:DNA replication and repair protein RecF
LVVNKLEINNFRNLNRLRLSFASERNLIFGANGSGKTSVIEALFLLGFGKSFLSVGRKELIQFGASGFFLNADILSCGNENNVSALLEQSFGLQLNGQKASLLEVGRHFYPLFFSHYSYNLAIDSTPYFRRLVDRLVYGLDSLYFHDVLRYNHALKQKNSLLRKLARPQQHSELNSWNTILAEMGCKVIERRMAFIDRLNSTSTEIFADDLRMHYHPALAGGPPYSPSSLMKDFDRALSAEVRCQRALVGPQRDRFEITVAGRRLPLFSSGEKKKYLLMAYMAYVELFRRARGEYPVFLIDDYDAALDGRNLDFLLDHFPVLQVIATSVTGNDRFAKRLELSKEM